MKKAERLNRELAYLVNHPFFHLADLMDEFRISRRTALRDITDLADLGLSVYSEPGRSGGYQVTSRGSLIHVTFSGDEVSAIFFALHALSLLSETPFRKPYQDIYDRLLASLPSWRRNAVTDMLDACRYYNVPPVYEIPFLREILAACTSRHIVRIASSQLPSSPVRAQLLWIFYRGGLWFFEGIDVDTGRWYRARCDLITGFQDTGSSGTFRREELKEQHDRFVREHHTIPFRCRISDHGKVRYYRERYENIHLSGNELTGSYNEDEFDYMIEYLIGYGSDVTVLAPEALRTAYAERLQEMLDRAVHIPGKFHYNKSKKKNPPREKADGKKDVESSNARKGG